MEHQINIHFLRDLNVNDMFTCETTVNYFLFRSAFHRFITRLTANDYEHNGLRIPKGVSVLIPTNHMHHNPELFPAPDTFDPER